MLVTHQRHTGTCFDSSISNTLSRVAVDFDTHEPNHQHCVTDPDVPNRDVSIVSQCVAVPDAPDVPNRGVWADLESFSYCSSAYCMCKRFSRHSSFSTSLMQRRNSCNKCVACISLNAFCLIYWGIPSHHRRRFLRSRRCVFLFCSKLNRSESTLFVCTSLILGLTIYVLGLSKIRCQPTLSFGHHIWLCSVAHY